MQKYGNKSKITKRSDPEVLWSDPYLLCSEYNLYFFSSRETDCPFQFFPNTEYTGFFFLGSVFFSRVKSGSAVSQPESKLSLDVSPPLPLWWSKWPGH